jgi:predicted TIM-barrel fold metal-dependent hydrolase
VPAPVPEFRDGLIDSLVHHAPVSEAEIAAYLPRAWQEFIGRPGSLPGGGGAMPFTPGNPYRNPGGDQLAGARPSSGPPGSSLDLLRKQLIDPSGAERIVLGHDALMLLPVHPNHHLGRELVRAVNDWCVDRWLSGQDDRLYGLILVQNQLPEAAAAEIRRLGGNPRMAGVLMGGNGLGKPFGHPIYHPIYEAAHEYGLPVVIHAGGDGPVDTLSEATAAGPAFTFAESHLLAPHAMITHAVSLIAQGVFVKMPELQVVMAAAGVAWALSVIWRFDNEYKALRREVPWLKEPTSHYFLRNLRLTTYPLDGLPTRQAWSTLLGAVPGLENVICFASGYPSWDTDAAADVAVRLPPDVHAKVFRDNATTVFRWSGPGGRRSAPRTGVGVMDPAEAGR